MHGYRIVYDSIFAEAMDELLGGGQRVVRAEMTGSPGVGVEEKIPRANDVLTSHLRQTGEGRFREAAESMAMLKETLEQLLEHNDRGGDTDAP